MTNQPTASGVSEEMVLRTYKYRLLPRKGQHGRLQSALSHTRALYNAALEERISMYRRTGKSASYASQCRGITELRKGPGFAGFAVSLQRWPLRKVDLAFRAFFRRLKAGEKPGFPRFKGRDWFKSFGFTDSDGWRVADGRLVIKGVGPVKIHLHRPLPARPISCSVKREGDGWTVSLVCEIGTTPLPKCDKPIGIDLGLTALAALSDGTIIPGFNAARRAEASMRRHQRSVARCKRGSKNRRKAKGQLARAHDKIKRSRATFLHQTAAQIVRENDLIVIEDLNVRGLSAGMLARSVNDAGWATFTDYLSYKAESAGRTVVRVSPSYTSQTCPECGQIKAKTLSERIHRCDCGCVMDRDVAAAKVILSRAVMRPGNLNVGSA